MEIVAAAASFAFGAVWYGALGDRWLAATGRTKEDIQADRSPLPFILAGITALLGAGALRWIFAAHGVDGALEGLRLGLALGLAVAAPWVVLSHAFSGRPRDLWWIDGGHAAIALGISGTVLGLMR